MPRRYYICDNKDCSHTFDITQKYEEQTLTKCPECKCETLYQDLSGMYFSVAKEPTTVGHLADRNTKKMGKYELESKIAADGIDKQVEKREKRNKLNKIRSMTQEQKTKYIYEG